MAISQEGQSSPRIKLGNICSSERIAGYSESVMLVTEPTNLSLGSTVDGLIRKCCDSPFCQLIGLAISEHQAGSNKKPDIPADPFDRITILISGGPWTQRMWLDDDSGVDTTITLSEDGDYIMWDPGFKHEWTPPKDSMTRMLTLTIRKWPK